MPTYRILAADLLSGIIRAELPLSTFGYSHVLNAPGGFTGTIGLRHPKATRANLDPGRTAIHIERDGAIAWSGILWTGRADALGDTLSLAGEGWWSYFRRRLIRTTKTYTATDQLAIARDLIDYAQLEAGGDVGVALDATTSGVLRDRTYPDHERKPVGEAVEQLAAVANGFDFAVEAAWSGGTVTKTLRLGYPRRGRDTQRVLELGVNLEALGQDIDAGRAANRIDAIGSGEGADQLVATATDAGQLTVYPLLEATIAHKDVTVLATLQAHADLALANRARPLELVPQLSVRQAHPDARLGALITGDTVTVRGRAGWLDVDAPMRVMALEVAVDASGAESATISFATEEATVA